jgi:DUF4097 and DUF4098 domain-containing protein YvlB
MLSFMRFALGTAGAVLAAASPLRADEWTKQWQVTAKPELHVEADDASVSIEAGAGGEITAWVKTKGVSIGDSGIRVIEHQSGNRVDLEVREPHQHSSWGMRSVEVRVRVPEQLAAEVRTGDGSVHLDGLHGAIRVSTGDGSIRAEGLDGNFEAHSGDGSMHVRGRFDVLRVHTQDGSVEVQAAEGSQLRSDWQVETGDGSVRIGLPRSLAADVQLRTGDGSIHTDIPLNGKTTESEHDVRGKLNGGGSLLNVRTGDGSISLNAL